MADEKKPTTSTATSSVGSGSGKLTENRSKAKDVLHTLDAISQPQSVKRFYIAYLTSDLVLAGLTYAVIMWIKIWAKASWESTWNNMWLFYLIFISILVGRITKAVTDYAKRKS